MFPERPLWLTCPPPTNRGLLQAVLKDQAQVRQMELEIRPVFLVPDTNGFIDHLGSLAKLLDCRQFILVVPLIGELEGVAVSRRSSPTPQQTRTTPGGGCPNAPRSSPRSSSLPCTVTWCDLHKECCLLNHPSLPQRSESSTVPHIFHCSNLAANPRPPNRAALVQPSPDFHLWERFNFPSHA